MELRKFVTFDGEVLDEDHYRATPGHQCFYCGVPVAVFQILPHCRGSIDGNHEWVDLVSGVH